LCANHAAKSTRHPDLVFPDTLNNFKTLEFQVEGNTKNLSETFGYLGQALPNIHNYKGIKQQCLQRAKRFASNPSLAIAINILAQTRFSKQAYITFRELSHPLTKLLGFFCWCQIFVSRCLYLSGVESGLKKFLVFGGADFSR
jgi:hypothetical protein